MERLKEIKARAERERLLAKQRRTHTKSPTVGGSAKFTFDHEGKVITVKKVNQDKLPETIAMQSKVAKKYLLKRQPDRLEDKPKDEKLISATKELMSNVISANKPLMERLK